MSESKENHLRHSEHGHGHGHHHQHQHGQSPSHAAKTGDMWEGEQYDQKPFINEFSQLSHDAILSSIKDIGLSQEDLKRLDVCDVGAGTGLVTERMLVSVHSIHAIDTSASMLKRLAWRFSDEDTVTHSLLSLSTESIQKLQSGAALSSPTADDADRMLIPPRSAFDLVYGSLMLHHVEDLDGFFEGLRAIVKPDHWVVFSEFGGHKDDHDAVLAAEVDAPVDSEIAFPWEKPKEGTVNQPGNLHKGWSRQSVTELFTKNGFKNVVVGFRGRLHWSKERSTPLMVVRAQRKID